MCLSARVSFAASVFLVVGGTAITIVAARKTWRYVPMAVVVIDMTLLTYAYFSFVCLLASQANLHLVYIKLTKKYEKPELFPKMARSKGCL